MENINVWRSPYLPQRISLYVTYHCHSQCSHCFLVEKNQLNRHKLDGRQIENILNDAQSNRVFMVIVAGGEPLLHPDIFSVISQIRQRSMLPLLAISGTGLNEDVAQKLADSGLSTVQVSLDASTQELNDAIRGPGNFDEVLRGIRLLTAHKIKTNVAICLHKENAADFRSFLEMMACLKVQKLKLAFYKRHGPNFKAQPLDDKERQSLIHIAASFIEKHGNPDWIASPTHDIASGAPLVKARRNIPVVIGADGVIVAGEGGPIIGSLSDGPVSMTYANFVSQNIKRYLDTLVGSLLRRYGISGIRKVSNIQAEGIVYRDRGYHILIKDGLPPQRHYFNVLHEIGHVANGTLRVLSGSRCSSDIEASTDLWALEQLRPHLDPHSYDEYCRLARSDRRAFLGLISTRFFNDIVYMDAYDVHTQL